MVPVVIWEYLQGRDRKNQHINIAKPKPIFPEFYPWFSKSINNYFDQYIASECSVLVLLGEAGSGKSSVIRSLIWYAGMKTMFTYDENLLESDSMQALRTRHDTGARSIVQDRDTFGSR